MIIVVLRRRAPAVAIHSGNIARVHWPSLPFLSASNTRRMMRHVSRGHGTVSQLRAASTASRKDARRSSPRNALRVDQAMHPLSNLTHVQQLLVRWRPDALGFVDLLCAEVASECDDHGHGQYGARQGDGDDGVDRELGHGDDDFDDRIGLFCGRTRDAIPINPTTTMSTPSVRPLCSSCDPGFYGFITPSAPRATTAVRYSLFSSLGCLWI